MVSELWWRERAMRSPWRALNSRWIALGFLFLFWLFIFIFIMNSFMNKENKLEGATSYRAWKDKIDLVLTRHKARKEKFQEDVILERSIIIKFVRDNIIPFIFENQNFQWDVWCHYLIVQYQQHQSIYKFKRSTSQYQDDKEWYYGIIQVC